MWGYLLYLVQWQRSKNFKARAVSARAFFTRSHEGLCQFRRPDFFTDAFLIALAPFLALIFFLATLLDLAAVALDLGVEVFLVG
ncbi:hypothetical protein L0337_31815, partial [candidate division KSB1 bacterium]|nr:hypothetical protein [candidate division KSB1 bacterium]